MAAVAASTVGRREIVPLAKRIADASVEATLFAVDKMEHWMIVESMEGSDMAVGRREFWEREMARLDDQASLLYAHIAKGWL